MGRQAEDAERMTTPARTPVPSPPQQNPYLPSKTRQQPLLRRANQTYAYQDDASQEDGGPSAAAGAYAPVASRRSQRPRRARRPRRRARHGVLSLLLWLVMLAVCALLALRTLPADLANGQMVPELVSFVPLALIPSALCLVLALIWYRRVLTLVCLAALAVNGWWHAGYFLGGQRVSAQASAAVAASATTEDAYARIMTLNTYAGQASAAQIVEICREQNVEVLCLQELSDGMLQDLEDAGIDELFGYSVISQGASSISNGGRNGIWTAAPQSNVSRNLLPIDTSSMPAADISLADQVVRIVCVHPNSPVRGAQDLWDEGLSVIGSLSNYSHAYVVMGDFNSTWDHARFRDLLGSSFADAGEASGEGFHMTYPSNSRLPAAIEIDHIAYSTDSGIVVSSLETVEVAGSDHKALLATLEAL